MNYDLAGPVKQVIDAYLFNLIKVYGLPSLVIILTLGFILWYLLRKKVDEEVKKEVNRHKAEIEFKYGGKIENYKLYINKKHMAYSEISELLTKTHSAIFGLEGMKTFQNFDEFDENDLKQYLENQKLTHKKIEEFLIKFNQCKTAKDFSVFQKEVINYLVMSDKSVARNFYNNVKSYFWLKKIYISSSISVLIKHFLELSNTLLIKYEVPILAIMSEEREEKKQLKKGMTTDLDNIIKKMKQELESL